jgi:AraC-like DNA-binding protein
MNLGIRDARREATVVKSQKTKSTDEAGVVELRAQVARQIAANITHPGDQATKVPGLILYRKVKPIECGSGQYEPSLNVFVQGQKRINVAGLPYLCDASSFLLTSVDLPVTSQILVASAEKPLLAMLLKFDMAIVREVVSMEEELEPEEGDEIGGMTMGTTTVELLNPCLRLLELLDKPADIPFMSNLLQREIVYRLLRGTQGRRLRAIATTGDQSHRVAKAVAWLRANYARPLRIEDLAELTHMGVSTLHHHFRVLTSMSPLQYQKQLRLKAARDKMLLDGLDAASAAFAVGYESANQFNREYSRCFGLPPMRDIKALRSLDGSVELLPRS